MGKTAREIIDKRRELWQANKSIELDCDYTQAVANYIVSSEGEHLRAEIKAKPEYLIEMLFVIVDKDKETVPFFLNEVQRSFVTDLNTAKEDFKAGTRLHLNFLVLKGRQQGFTSFITAYQLANSIVVRNFSGMTIADSGDNTTTIFEDKAKFTYDKLPDQIKPTEKYNNRREFHFEKLNSRWRVNTAGNKNVGRSKTINFLHGSEAAFWENMQSIMKGLGQSLTKDSIKILETTANGFNEYKTIWDGAEDGTNNWEAKFYEWWLTPEYVLNFENKDRESEFKQYVEGEADEFSQKLKWLKDKKGLSWQQLYWYLSKYKELGADVGQEYPCTPDEAFLMTGRPVFDIKKVIARKDELKQLYKANKPLRGNFLYDYAHEKIVDKSIRFSPDPNGFVTIYSKPEPNIPYVIGGDIAEGGVDFSAGQVENNITGNQVAVWHGHIDTDLFAKQMYCLGKYYNDALIAIETNFDLHPVKELQRLGYRKQYRREVIDEISKVKQHKNGFMTTTATRPVIIALLVELVRDEIERIYDISTLDEMIRFVRNEVGKPEAMEGYHDDLVLSLAIAEKAREQQSTKPFEDEPQEEDTYNAYPRRGRAG